MSTTEPAGFPERTDHPEVDLHARFDDLADPTELTIYSADVSDDPTTTWLTIDADHAIPLENIR
jgi:hypothetical protein